MTLVSRTGNYVQDKILFKINESLHSQV